MQNSVRDKNRVSEPNLIKAQWIGFPSCSLRTHAQAHTHEKITFVEYETQEHETILFYQVKPLMLVTAMAIQIFNGCSESQRHMAQPSINA